MNPCEFIAGGYQVAGGVGGYINGGEIYDISIAGLYTGTCGDGIRISVISGGAYITGVTGGGGAKYEGYISICGLCVGVNGVVHTERSVAIIGTGGLYILS